MEITSLNKPPRLKRVEGILQAVQRYFPEYQLPAVKEAKVWSGFRPCSADGLPYIGKSKRYHNLLFATGHAMVGMSLGAGTGQLISELANEQQPSMDLRPFDPERFN
jgi:D-amino-acid dehydrogenase